VKFFFRNKPKATSFSFPDSDLELGDDLIKDLHLAAGLKRIARVLFDQSKERRERVVGIEISGVRFHFIYEAKDQPEE
jgi:hypothetical protein